MKEPAKKQNLHSNSKKIILITIGSALLFLAVLIAGVNFWLTDERLRSVVIEPLREIAGEEADPSRGLAWRSED